MFLPINEGVRSFKLAQRAYKYLWYIHQYVSAGIELFLTQITYKTKCAD